MYTDAGDTLMPGQQLPGLTPAEAAILVPHHGAGADYHAPPPPAGAARACCRAGPVDANVLTATIANANIEPPPPPPSLVSIAVDDPDLLVRAPYTLLRCQAAGDIPNQLS
jgi:hypothetical protein